MFLFVTLVVVFAHSLNPLRFRLVDKNVSSMNFIIRGDFPGSSIEGHAFVDPFLWEETLRVLVDVEAGVKLTDFRIFDLNLLHSYGDDKSMVDAEIEYFKKHPEKGVFIHHEINGTAYPNATTLSESKREALLQNLTHWDIDHLATLIPSLHDFLSKKLEKPTVFYIHCAGGVDRTGEVSGAYYMQYLGWTMKKTYAYDTKVKGGRLIGTGNAVMMNWYCYYVTEKLHLGSKLGCSEWY